MVTFDNNLCTNDRRFHRILKDGRTYTCARCNQLWVAIDPKQLELLDVPSGDE